MSDAKRHTISSVTKQQSIVNVAKRRSIAMQQMSRSEIGTVNFAKRHEPNKF